MFLFPQIPAIVNIMFNRFPCSASFPYAGAEPKYCINNPLGTHSKMHNCIYVLQKNNSFFKSHAGIPPFPLLTEWHLLP